MRKVLVTGGAGFVGRHLCRALLDLGDEVHCVDSIVPHTGAVDPDDGWPLYDPRAYENFKFYREDCRDYFRRVFDTDFDYTFHLAAVVGGRIMIEKDALAVATDLAIDSDYWKWATKARPRKSVCFSSSAAYPIKYQTQQNYRLLTEALIDFKKPIDLPDLTYGWAKLTLEYLARVAFERYGLHSVCYRPFSGYGEDQDQAYPFPSICKRAQANTDHTLLKVWGTGEQMRDFIHIDDCIRGVLKTMDAIDNGEAINLSTGILTSFKDFAATAARLCGYKPRIEGESDKPEGVFARGGDTTKQEKLGFVPKIAFAEGIQRALDYYSKPAQHLHRVGKKAG